MRYYKETKTFPSKYIMDFKAKEFFKTSLNNIYIDNSFELTPLPLNEQILNIYASIKLIPLFMYNEFINIEALMGLTPLPLNEQIININVTIELQPT